MNIFKKLLLFFFDYLLLTMCLSLFLPTLDEFLIPLKRIPGLRHVKIFVFLLLLMLAVKGILSLARRKSETLVRYTVALFFFFLVLVSAFSFFLTGRLLTYASDYPTWWVLASVVFGLIVAWFLPRRLVWRKAPFFLGFALFFNVLCLAASRQFVNIKEFAPIEIPGIKVVRTIIDFDVENDEEHPKWLVKRGGMLLQRLQYGYLALDKDENHLLADDFLARIMLGNLYMIRLDDFREVARFSDYNYFRDRLHDPDKNQVIVANWRLGNKITFLSLPDLKQTGILKMGFPTRGGFAGIQELAGIQHIRLLERGRMLVTSEQGCFKIFDSDYRLLEERCIPTHTQEIALDRARRILALGSLAGYTLATLNVDTLEVLKKRIASFASWGVAMDPEKSRIFLPRLLLGDLLVCDEETLETITRVPLEPGLRIVQYVPEHDLIVTGNYFNGNLYFVSGKDYRPLRTLWVGSKIRSIVYSPVRDRLYVSTGLRILEINVSQVLNLAR